MLNRNAVVAVGAAGVVIAGMIGAYTASSDTVTVTDITSVDDDYISDMPITATPAAPLATFTTDSGTSITPVYGHQPAWSNVADGTSAVPSAVQEAGDIVYIEPTSPDSTDAGEALRGFAVRGVITNAPALAADYGTCQLPLAVRMSSDNGSTWDDVTHNFFDVNAGDPYYFDCRDENFDFRLGVDTLDNIIALSIERGGSLTPRDNKSDLSDPNIFVTATPITNTSSIAAVRTANDCVSGFTFVNGECTGTFNAGAAQSFIVPSGVNEVDFTLVGASGGNGGRDGGASGGSGGVGGQVSGTLSVGGGDVLAFAAGTRGSAGSSDVAGTGGGAGGTNALSSAYNGGRGGNAGSQGTSGAGGGGGAASILRWTDTSASTTTTVVAAGGGGGGGAGQSNGFAARTSHSPYNLSATAGRNGFSHPVDGGGSGAGGGGAVGGNSGSTRSGDEGAYGGYRGLNGTAALGGLTEGLAGLTGNGLITITY